MNAHRPAAVSQTDSDARPPAVKIPFDKNVAGAFQGCDVRPEVTLGGVDDAWEPNEFQPSTAGQPGKRGHDPQSHRLVDHRVGLRLR